MPCPNMPKKNCSMQLLSGRAQLLSGRAWQKLLPGVPCPDRVSYLSGLGSTIQHIHGPTNLSNSRHPNVQELPVCVSFLNCLVVERSFGNDWWESRCQICRFSWFMSSLKAKRDMASSKCMRVKNEDFAKFSNWRSSCSWLNLEHQYSQANITILISMSSGNEQ
jgi:hypothetical protein